MATMTREDIIGADYYELLDTLAKAIWMDANVGANVGALCTLLYEHGYQLEDYRQSEGTNAPLTYEAIVLWLGY